MNNTALRGHKLQNFLQTLLLLTGMVVILSTLGWMFFGLDGIIWAFSLGLIGLLFSPRITPKAMLKAYGARPLEPQEAPALYQAVGELARRADLPRTPKLYYVRSSIMNAFAVGNSDQAAIAVTDGLLRTLSLRELTAVLAHEISHVRNNDMWVMGLADVISRITSLFSLLGQVLLLLYLPLLFAGYHLAWGPVLLLVGAPSISALLQLALSRSREYDADMDGALLSGDPRALASALNKMERYQGNLFERIFLPGRRDPHPSLLRTHPPTEERIRRLLEIADTQDKEQPVIPAGHVTQSGHLHGFPIEITRQPRWRMGFWY